MNNFLDKTGLAYLWQHIVAKLGTKVDKVDGKGLSTNDFTDEYKNRVDSVADLDHMSEIITYIEGNRDLIESITVNKVNVSDIVDNLTTDEAEKPLSAAQGVVLKGLIDNISTNAGVPADFELISVNDVDAICGAVYQDTSIEEVTF